MQCVNHLYAANRYEDAWCLMRRAEEFEPRGWRILLPGVAKTLPGVNEYEDYVKCLLTWRLEDPDQDPVNVVMNFRESMAPILSLINDDREEVDREVFDQEEREREEATRDRMRKTVFDEMEPYWSKTRILETVYLRKYRNPDSSACDWWQDLVWKWNVREAESADEDSVGTMGPGEGEQKIEPSPHVSVGSKWAVEGSLTLKDSGGSLKYRKRSTLLEVATEQGF